MRKGLFWLSLQLLRLCADISSEPEVTLVIQLGYRGAAFCGFAEQPSAVAVSLRHLLSRAVLRKAAGRGRGRRRARPGPVREPACVRR